MYGYVYKTTDLRNNKIYIGQHKSNNFDDKYYGSGVRITRLLEKYGKENFKCEIIEECYSKDHLNEREIYWIDYLDSRNPDKGYNIASGGTWGDSGYHLGMLGKSQSEKQKLAASINGSYKRTDEWKLNKSVSMAGNDNGHGNKGRESTFKGKHHSDSSKKLLSDKLKIAAKNWYDNLPDDKKEEKARNISKGKSGAICITDGIKNYYIQPNDWPKYEKDYFKMSLAKYKKLMNKTTV